MTYDWLVLQKDRHFDHDAAAASAAAGSHHSLLLSSISTHTHTQKHRGRAEFIMKLQASQSPYRSIFNIRDHCLFSGSNQIVDFAYFCPQLFKNISLTPSLTLIHHSTYRGHDEVSVWEVSPSFLQWDVTLLINRVLRCSFAFSWSAEMSEVRYNKSGRGTEASADALTFTHISFFLRHFNIKSIRK